MPPILERLLPEALVGKIRVQLQELLQARYDDTSPVTRWQVEALHYKSCLAQQLTPLLLCSFHRSKESDHLHVKKCRQETGASGRQYKVLNDEL